MVPTLFLVILIAHSAHNLLQIGIDPLTNVMEHVGLGNDSQFKSIHSNFQIATIAARNKLTQSFAHAANQINAQQRASDHIIEMKNIYQEMIRNGLFYDVIKLDLFGMFARLFKRLNETQMGLYNIEQLKIAFHIDDVKFKNMDYERECLESRLLKLLCGMGKRILLQFSHVDKITYCNGWMTFYKYIWHFLSEPISKYMQHGLMEPLPGLDVIAKGYKITAAKSRWLMHLMNIRTQRLILLDPKMMTVHSKNPHNASFDEFLMNLVTSKQSYADTSNIWKICAKPLANSYYKQYFYKNMLFQDGIICFQHRHLQRLFDEHRSTFDWLAFILVHVLISTRQMNFVDGALATLEKADCLWILDKHHYKLMKQSWIDESSPLQSRTRIKERTSLLIKYFGDCSKTEFNGTEMEALLCSMTIWKKEMNGHEVQKMLRRTQNKAFIKAVIKTMEHLTLIDNQQEYVLCACIAKHLI